MSRILSKDFKYTPAAATDIRKTFARIRRQMQINAAPQAADGQASGGQFTRAPSLIDNALASGKTGSLAVAVPTHTDHPLRHYDRTCPACIAPNVRAIGRRAAK